MSSHPTAARSLVSVDRSNESSSTERIADSLARLETLLAGRPEFGGTTNRSVTTSSVGLRCWIEEGDWTHTADLGAALGGAGVLRRRVSSVELRSGAAWRWGIGCGPPSTASS